MTKELNDFIGVLENEHSLVEFYNRKEDIIAMLKSLGGVKRFRRGGKNASE